MVELLVVVTAIGVMVGMATLAISSGDNRELEHQAKRLRQVLNLAIDEATYNQTNLGFLREENGYRFLTYNNIEGEWQPFDEEPFQPTEYPLALISELILNGAELAMPAPKDENDADKKTQGPLPELVILASGELSAFEMVLALDQDESPLHRLSSDGFSLVKQRVIER